MQSVAVTSPVDVEIRVATLDDEDYFVLLWREFLIEMHNKGSEILPTDRTLDFYLNVFRAYTEGRVDGAAVVAIGGGQGVTMAGDVTMPIDTDFGKTALGWGTYVPLGDRGRGLAATMRKVLRRELRVKGFQTVLGGVHVGDDPAMTSMRDTGWVPYQIHGYDDLRRGD